MLIIPAHVRTGPQSPKRGRNGIYYIPRSGYRLRAVVSDSCDWESVALSVDGKARTPSWDDVCHARDTFWSAGDAVLQFYPHRAYRPDQRQLTLWRSKVSPPLLPAGRWTLVQRAAVPLPLARFVAAVQPRSHRQAKPPSGAFLTAAQLAQHAGMDAHNLQAWRRRYGFPASVGVDRHGHRRYTREMADRLRAFVRAGKPFREIVDGVWPPLQPARAPAMDWIAHFLGEVPAELLVALKGRHRGAVAEILAKSARMREVKRAAVLACIRAANGTGVFNQVLRQHAAAL